MLWEEFSSVLLLPPCGKFEDLYIYINAVNCYWTQKQERSKKICLGCFLRVNWPGWIGGVCHVPAPPLWSLHKTAVQYQPYSNAWKPLRITADPVLDGTGLLQSLWKRKSCIHGLCCCLLLLLVVFSKHLQPCSGKAESCLLSLLPSIRHLIKGSAGKVEE